MWTGGIYKYNWLLLGGTEYDPASDDRKKSTWLKKNKKKQLTNKKHLILIYYEQKITKKNYAKLLWNFI